MANTVAVIVFFSWPIVVYLLFRALPVASAVVWSVLAGYLLLPARVGINLPMIPTVDKQVLPALAALVVLLLFVPKSRKIADLAGAGTLGPVDPPDRPPRPRGMLLIWGLIGLFVIAQFVTVFQNPEPVIFGPRVMPGLKPYDALSRIGSILAMLLPFFLAWRFLGHPDKQIMLLRALVLSALAYSLLALFEIRMSPQLNRWFYGFFPHTFAQHLRGDGFRPLVFLQHGLWLGIYLTMAIIAATTLCRQAWHEGRSGLGWLLSALWLTGTLVLSKNLGALGLALLFSPMVLLVGQRLQLILAVCVAGAVLLYPVLRGSGYMPINTVMTIAEGIDEQRAQSFAFRLHHEDLVLERAREKPLGGWGGYGRNRFWNEETGDKEVTTDGLWIIYITSWGWLGYLALFGLLTAPVFLIAASRRRLNLSPATSGLCLVLAASLIDLIPNATMTPVTWLVTGALVGRYAFGAVSQGATASSFNSPATGSNPLLGPSPSPLISDRPTNHHPDPIIAKAPHLHQRRSRTGADPSKTSLMASRSASP